MEKSNESSNCNTESASQRPTAFTIDFGNEKKIDTQRQKTLAEKFQKKRGKSLSKCESDTRNEPISPTVDTFTKWNKNRHSSNFPTKSNLRPEDEKTEQTRNCKVVAPKRSDLTLVLKNVSSSRMTQSFPNSNNHSSPNKKTATASSSADLPSKFNLKSSTLDNGPPSVEFIKLISSNNSSDILTDLIKRKRNIEMVKKGVEDQQVIEEKFPVPIDLDNYDKKSDTASEAGTYTLSMDNYSEEQKARMSIDSEFKIEQISLRKKTEDYIKSLSQQFKQLSPQTTQFQKQKPEMEDCVSIENYQNLKSIENFDNISVNQENLQSPSIPKSVFFLSNRILSPILSPTSQNLSVGDECSKLNEQSTIKYFNNDYLQSPETTFSKNSVKNPAGSSNLIATIDEGSIISVTSSGAFRSSRSEDKNKSRRQLGLIKSEVFTETYVNGETDQGNNNKRQNNHCKQNKLNKLTANIVNVQNIEIKTGTEAVSEDYKKKSNGILTSSSATGSPSNKLFHSKIPSPIHSLSQPRSNFVSTSSSTDDLDTDFILKPTQNYINQLQRKLSLDNSDQDSDYDRKFDLQLNNTAHLLKQKALHIRHNSLDERIIKNNKLEHFQNKNLQTSIDQIYGNNALLNQYKQMNKLNNSPSGSPIRKSSSFSNRTQIKMTKNTNISTNNSATKPSSASSVHKKQANLCQSPNLSYNKNNIQRSSSTASIKPNYIVHQKGTTNSSHKKIDRSKFGDTESSSEEDFNNSQPPRRKDLSGNIWNTRCNRTFGLRRARFDSDTTKLKCPNTPDMRRKTFHPDQKHERSVSVDRKPVKTNEVQSRYLLNINKKNTPLTTVSTSKNLLTSKNVLQHKASTTKSPIPVKKTSKPSSLSTRTNAGQSSNRTTSAHSGGKPHTPNFSLKNDKREEKCPSQSNGARSNSSLSSKEMEFQNWKRRKSYDPMKAAAEGKRKELQKKLSGMTNSYSEALTKATNQNSPDSSQSHSGSVYRSQSFQGTAALEQLISSEDELTLSVDEGFSPPTPSPCELSPAKARLKYNLWERIHN